MTQREMFTTEASLARHLQRCGLARLQIELVILIWREGDQVTLEDREYRTLRISSRSAARKLRGTSSSAVVEAAGRVEKKGLLRVVRDAPRRPPLYVLDCLACRALVPSEDRLDELLADCSDVLGRARTCSDVLGVTPVTPVGLSIQTSCAPVTPGNSRGGVGGSGIEHRAPTSTSEQSRAPRLPWSRARGFTDDDLVAAVRRQDIDWLASLFDEAVRTGHVCAPSGERRSHSDAWLRFLTLVHCVARRPYRSKRAALVAAVKRDIDVSRTAQVDERWASRMLRREWAVPTCPS